jgi:DtxR family Mn-dependent transcriptional regulator
MLEKPNIRRPRSPLGQSSEDYLEAVLVLGKEKQTVRVKDVAGKLGVTRPSVVLALAGLEAKGLVRHERYGGVELTPGGRRVAQETDRRHRLVKTFLVQVLGVKEATADKDACRIEHSLSPETVSRLVDFTHRSRK